MEFFEHRYLVYTVFLTHQTSSETESPINPATISNVQMKPIPMNNLTNIKNLLQTLYK